MKIVRRLAIIPAILAMVFVGLPANAATGTCIVGGSVFSDVDHNGYFSLGDVPVKGATVSIYGSVDDAVAKTTPLAVTTSGTLGTYSIRKLVAGTYYVSVVADGYDASLNVAATVTKLRPIGTAPIPLKKVTNLQAAVFEDVNSNGVMDTSEKYTDGKTLIYIDVRKTIEMIDAGTLESFDIASAIGGAINGTIDIGGAIIFKTTAKGSPITYPDVDPGVYIIMRSPFNLTPQSLIADLDRIKAFVDVIVSGDPAEILALDPTLLSTGDITTTPQNEYLRKMTSSLSNAIASMNSIDFESYLGPQLGAPITNSLGVFAAAAGLLKAIPATQFAMVGYWGTSWSLTDLKVTQTNQFLFGARPYASISGTVFSDNNLDGVQQIGNAELAATAKLTLYNAAGEIVSTMDAAALTGAYKFTPVPGNVDLYLELSGNSKTPSGAAISGLPTALAGKKIVGKYNITDTNYTIVQNVGLATPVSWTVSQPDPNGKVAVVFTNKNTAEVNLSYQIDGNVPVSATIKKATLLASATSAVTLAGLTPGDHTISFTWSKGSYQGAQQTATITVPQPQRIGSISGVVFNDSDLNGSKGTLESAQANVVIRALDSAGNELATATSNTSGAFTFGSLSRDVDIYLEVSGTTKTPSLTYAGALPTALVGKNIVAMYALTDSNYIVAQNMGLADIKDVIASVGTANAAGDVVLTLTNKNSQAVNVSYSLENGEGVVKEVPRRVLSDGAALVTLATVSPGQHSLTYFWSKGPYQGKSIVLDFTVPTP